MNELFNTVFETELRLLLLLEASLSIKACESTDGQEVCQVRKTTAEKLAAIDFITIYGASFGLTKLNLHGDGDYKFSEFAVRRDLTQKALRELVRRGFVNVENSQEGFVYTMTDAGLAFCNELADEYANEYRESSFHVMDEMSNLSERDLTAFINRYSINSLKRN